MLRQVTWGLRSLYRRIHYFTICFHSLLFTCDRRHSILILIGDEGINDSAFLLWFKSLNVYILVSALAVLLMEFVWFAEVGVTSLVIRIFELRISRLSDLWTGFLCYRALVAVSSFFTIPDLWLDLRRLMSSHASVQRTFWLVSVVWWYHIDRTLTTHWRCTFVTILLQWILNYIWWFSLHPTSIAYATISCGHWNRPHTTHASWFSIFIQIIHRFLISPFIRSITPARLHRSYRILLRSLLTTTTV